MPTEVHVLREPIQKSATYCELHFLSRDLDKVVRLISKVVPSIRGISGTWFIL